MDTDVLCRLDERGAKKGVMRKDGDKRKEGIIDGGEGEGGRRLFCSRMNR